MSSAVSVREWWRQRRLGLHDISRPVRILVWVSFGVVAASVLLILAVGAGWDPWGGRQFAAYGGQPPRLIVPWASCALGILAFAVVMSTTMPGWRHPRPVRIAAGLGGAALAAQGVSMGWIISAAGVDARWVVSPGWLGLIAGGFVVLVPQKWAKQHPWWVASAAATPFLLGLLVWISVGGTGLVLPGGPLLSARDAYAQAMITVIGTVAAAAGILILWGLVVSTRQARDIGEGLADLHKTIPVVLWSLLVVKVGWLILAYADLVFGGTVTPAVDDGWTAWVIGLMLVGTGGWWFTQVRTEAPTDYEGREWLRAIGFGYAAAPIAAVIVALMAAVAGVLWTLEPSARLNDVLGWLIGIDPPVALWVVVGVSALSLLATALMWRRTSRPAGWIAVAVVGVWATPRAMELTARILQLPAGIDAPSLVTIDTVITCAIVVGAGATLRNRGARLDAAALTMILAASTLIAHPLGIMPAGWQTGLPFYLVLVYPFAYSFLFDSVWLNGLDPVLRPGRVLRTVAVTALLVVTTSLLVLLDRIGPGFETAEAALLGAIGEAYLLYPAAVLAVAATLRRRITGVDDGSLGTQATRRWVWSSVTARIPTRGGDR